MDNRIFNVNGRTKNRLQKTIDLIIDDWQGVKGWEITEKGLVLKWHSEENKGNKFPVPLKSDTIVDIVWDWLNSEEGRKFETIGDWDHDADHDGHNERGWRVYCEDWGHVGDDHYAICAVVPAYIWYGK